MNRNGTQFLGKKNQFTRFNPLKKIDNNIAQSGRLPYQQF